MSELDGLRLHGASISYFTGKLEAALRYKELPYTFVATSPDRLRERAAAAQVPALELADGRWATDTTPILAWLDVLHPETSLTPADPALAFYARLVEDYADEWLWRPAMHYRWSYEADRFLCAGLLADEFAGHLKVPRWLVRRRIARRQLGNFVTGDGVDAGSRPHVEATYRRALSLMSDALAEHPFLFGDRPTLADIGLMGPMLRHFAHEPTPAWIMVQEAPRVFSWVARTWSARASELGDAPLVDALTPALEALLVEIGETHLTSLAANAEAWAAGATRHEMTIQGAHYRGARVSRYRVWCLEQLRAGFAALPPAIAEGVKATLEATGCWAPLMRYDGPPSGHDPQGAAPFGVGLETIQVDRESAG